MYGYLVETIAKTLAANMKIRRKELGLTQDSLAERADLSKITIQQLETCNVWFGPDTIANIARALECSENALFQAPIDITDCAKRVATFVAQVSKK